ncbi:E3 ubiquitin-protein ligase TRAIP-like [Daphnia pulex]|uniref:E3 ubiquitin-protein ligase TRAIP-like n=1 Tax=Daphnia pulex TaxID=6669 RepID=UPI001EDDF72E|nr:E3 ubiquitin-protein ligase TRAIP-like [Daphnia pulex]XP_046442205.1 E3 ubiquitin-protein ligase TRAIP-like [Daphnia pulex]
MRVQCAVCWDPFCDSDFVMAPRCGHLFHNKCIQQWLGTHRDCPTCRQASSIRELRRVFLDSVEVDPADLQLKLDEMSRELNTEKQLKQFADEELRKCRKLLSTSRLELKKTKNQLKKKVDSEDLQKKLEEMTRERNAQLQLNQFADEELRKCRVLLITSRLELKNAKKELKEQSSLAEAEKATLKEKLEAFTESISSPSGDPPHSALSQFKKMKFDLVPSTSGGWVTTKKVNGWIITPGSSSSSS